MCGRKTSPVVGMSTAAVVAINPFVVVRTPRGVHPVTKNAALLGVVRQICANEL